MKAQQAWKTELEQEPSIYGPFLPKDNPKFTVKKDLLQRKHEPPRANHKEISPAESLLTFKWG